MAMIKARIVCGALLFGIFGASCASGGSHGHHRFHAREGGLAIETQVITVPVKQFEYNGRLLHESEVCQGIMNGTLHWAQSSDNTPDCAKLLAISTAMTTTTSEKVAPIPVVTITITVTPSAALDSSLLVEKPFLDTSISTLRSVTMSMAAKPAPFESSSAKTSTGPATYLNHVALTTSSVSSAIVSPSAQPPAMPSDAVQLNAFVQENTNVDVEFPDGQVDCSEFPGAYGAIQVPWMNFGGWTGIQFAQIADNAIVGLATGVNGNECIDGHDGSTTFCSYACPPGYQKSQWPTTQGNASMAVSVGGLKCENGKLYLTNPSLSASLCVEGTGKSFVTNKLDGIASICRTDYPGTEDETVPLLTEGGNTYPLTCPNSSVYYQHLGAQTSAEYYVNNKNVPVETACQWDTNGSGEGNWAPVVIGTETDSTGATWLSIMTSRQNNPINYKELEFSIELVGDFGGAACYYTQHNGVGYYCSAGTLADFDPTQESCKSYDPSAGVTVPGCTVQLFSGTATYNLVETA